jgi:mycothiol synthase
MLTPVGTRSQHSPGTRSTARDAVPTLRGVPELPDGLTARPMTTADLPAAAELLAAAEPVDDTGEHLDIDDLAEWWVDDLVDLPCDGRAVCTGDGDLVAVAVVVPVGGAREDQHVMLEGGCTRAGGDAASGGRCWTGSCAAARRSTGATIRSCPPG